ncbi:hypothetical protein ACWCQR_38095, partial [Streptomyces sp. NPDC002172]
LMLALVFARLVTGGPLPLALTPTIFLVLGPLGSGNCPHGTSHHQPPPEHPRTLPHTCFEQRVYQRCCGWNGALRHDGRRCRNGTNRDRRMHGGWHSARVRRRLGLSACAAACAAALAALTGVLRFSWDDASTEGVLVSAIGTLVSVAALVADVLRGDADPAPRSAEEDRCRAADALAEAVREQWAAEARLRRLQDPEPIEVGWAPADRRLADHPENVGRGGRLPAPRAWRVEDLAAWFAGLPGRRLVVLGGPVRECGDRPV